MAAGIARVVSALEDPNPQVAGEGHRRLAAAGIAVTVGIGADAARRAHAGHIRRMRERRPQVNLKLAVSADGKAGLAGRRPTPITGEPARARVHLMRAMSDAVLTGIGTALSDDPLLTCRLPGMADRSPVRVVLDGGLRLRLRLAAGRERAADPALDHHRLRRRRQTASKRCRTAGAEVLRVPAPGGRLDLAVVLERLAARGITRLMVEAGPILAAALLAADLVDEAALLRSPKVIGPDGIDALEGLPLTALITSSRFELIRTEWVGQDTIDLLARR